MAYEHRMTRRVAFSETDMAGLMHFANFFRWMEDAEHAFFRAQGLSVHMELEGRKISWPRVDASCRFLAPLRFEDEAEVRTLVTRVSTRSMECVHVIRRAREQDKGWLDVARGRITLVCVELSEDGTMQAVEVPRRIAERIEAAPADVLAELNADPRRA